MSGGIAAAGLAMAVIGTAVSAMGQMQQAKAAQASANYQSEVAASNQQIATQNANYTAASGEEQAAVQEQKTRQQIGEITAGQGSSGVDINSPTSTAVRASQSEVGALDAQTIRSNAARAAYGYETQSTNFGNQAAAEKATAENAGISGDIGAGASLLSGIGGASTNYAKLMGNASGLTDGSVGEGAASLYDNPQAWASQ